MYRDDIQVPHPSWNTAVLGVDGGPPRAVPFAAAMQVLSQVVGAPLAQRLVLAAPLLLVGTGVGVLLRKHGALAASTGALVAIWNPYVAERLGLGQAPTLLAYGALPWLLVSTATVPRPRRVAGCALAFVPAALTPVGSVLGLATLVVGLSARRAPARTVALSVAGPLLMCLPWVTAGLAAPVAIGQPEGAAAYAVRSDSPLGLAFSVATLGGVWAPTAVPDSRGSVVSMVTGILLLACAATGWLRHGRRSWLLAGWAVPVLAALTAAAGPVVTFLAHLQGIPGVGLFRDTHRLLAPSALALALGVGLLMGRERPLRTRATATWRSVALTSMGARVGVVLGVAALCLLNVPDLAATVARHYRPVEPPHDWQQALTVIGKDDGAVLSLPWQPLRRTSWNRAQPFLDPVPLAAGGRTLHSTRLQVSRDGRILVSDGDALPPAPGWQQGRVTASELSDRGVAWVLLDRVSPGPEVSAEGLGLVVDGPNVRLWRVPGVVTGVPRPRAAAVVTAALAVAALVPLVALCLVVVTWCRSRLAGARAHPRNRFP